MAETREENVYLPKLTEKAAERCEEMVKFMEKVAYKNVEERSIILCSTKYKNVTRAVAMAGQWESSIAYLGLSG